MSATAEDDDNGTPEIDLEEELPFAESTQIFSSGADSSEGGKAPMGFPHQAPEEDEENYDKRVDQYLQRVMSVMLFHVHPLELMESYNRRFKVITTQEDMIELVRVFGSTMEETFGCKIVMIDPSKPFLDHFEATLASVKRSKQLMSFGGLMERTFKKKED